MNDQLDPHFDESKFSTLPVGQVMAKQRGEYRVLHNLDEIVCGIRSRMRKNLVYPLSRQRRQSVDDVRAIKQVDPISVGDFVRFSTQPDNTSAGVIEQVEPRRNQLSRRDPGLKPLESVICSNVDKLFLVFSIRKPRAKPGIIDRYIVAAAWEDIPTVIVINKIDLCSNDEINHMVEMYRNSGCQIVLTSAETGEGVDELRELMSSKMSVLVGPTGVGKSSLLNSMEPGLNLKVNAISEFWDTGKHTTTHLEVYRLQNKGLVLDTPGISKLALWNLDPDELFTLFPEMDSIDGRCKYGASCRHETEPGCIIKDAVEDGNIHPERYKSFMKIRKELEKLYSAKY